MRAVAYIRQSRSSEDSVSAAMQIEACRAYAENRGWEFNPDEAQIDLDVSGYSTKWRERPGLAALADHDFDVLIVYKLDRLARNLREALSVFDHFESRGIGVASVVDNIDSTTPSGTFLRNMLLMVAEFESQGTSVRVKSAALQRAKAGRIHGGRLPGWLKRDDQGQIILNSEKATIYQRIVQLRLEGHSYVKIARQINAEGHRTSSGTIFHRGYVAKVLRPDFIESMKGTAYFHRPGRKSQTKNGKKVALADTTKIEGAYPRLIYDEDADRITNLYQALTPDEKSKRISQTSTNLPLKGLLRCSECGSRMVVHRRNKHGKVAYSYRCETASISPVKHTRSLVDADMLDKAVIGGLERVLQRRLQAHKPVKQPVIVSTEAVEREIAKLISLVTKAIITEDDFQRAYDDLQLRKKQIEEANQVQKDVIWPDSIRDLDADRLRLELSQMVEIIEFPRWIGNHKRVFAGITLKNGQKIVVPIYKNSYTGDRGLRPDPDQVIHFDLR